MLENFREREMPMEETVLSGELLDFLHHAIWQAAFGEIAEMTARDANGPSQTRRLGGRFRGEALDFSVGCRNTRRTIQSARRQG